MNKRKLLPVFIMLLAGAIASIMAAVMQYELEVFLLIVLITLAVFYLMGLALLKIYEVIEIQKVEETLDEGAVIEKDVSADMEDIGPEDMVERTGSGRDFDAEETGLP